MPTYEYRCPQGHEFEEFQSIVAEPVARCPKCRRKSRRLVSAGAGLIFKGSGFYATDYAKKSTLEPRASDDGRSRKAPRPNAASAATDTSA
jgi:putative FmdB family regulatory protein